MVCRSFKTFKSTTFRSDADGLAPLDTAEELKSNEPHFRFKSENELTGGADGDETLHVCDVSP